MSGKSVREMLAEANAEIETIPAEAAAKLVGDPDVVFVDVRESLERQQTGGIAGSVHAPRGFLEFQADPESPAHNPAIARDKHIVLYCAAGSRSALAGKTLKQMGFSRVSHVGGGFHAWQAAGGPTEG